MTEKALQSLHLRAVCGEALTSDENAALQDWYRRNDHEEAAILNAAKLPDSNEELKEKISATLKRVAEVTRDIEETIAENERLRADIAEAQKLLTRKIVDPVA